LTTRENRTEAAVCRYGIKDELMEESALLPRGIGLMAPRMQKYHEVTENSGRLEITNRYIQFIRLDLCHVTVRRWKLQPIKIE